MIKITSFIGLLLIVGPTTISPVIGKVSTILGSSELHTSFHNIIKQATRSIDADVFQFSNSSTKCNRDLSRYLRSIISHETNNTWALQMLDASVKIPNGILVGNWIAMGQFGECLDIRADEFSGQHCMLDVDIPLTGQKMKTENEPSVINLFYGICFPSTCSAADLNKIFKSELPSINIKADDANCWTDDKKVVLDDGDWAYIAVLIVVGVAVLLSTCYESYERFVNQNDKPKRVYCAFSLYSNAKSFCTISTSNAEMGCLNGIRTLSMAWVVLGHTYENALDLPYLDATVINKAMFSDDHILVTNGAFSVDTFFLLSGLLVAFVFFRNIGKFGYFDVPMSYLHRWLRLTPQLMFVALLHMTIFDNTGKGPLWFRNISVTVNSCRTNWWVTLLYLQNYVDTSTQCLSQSWYLAVDMQLYWISPFLLYLVFFWPKQGLIGLVCLVLSSTLWSFGLDLNKGYGPSPFLDESGGNQVLYEYVATHKRMAPFLIGMILGTIMCFIKSKKIKIRLSRGTVLAGWSVSAALCLASLYSFARFTHGSEYTTVETAFYLTFTRLSWGLGIAWIVFACIYGYGGVINSFLSLSIFQPLGKLSYGVYLIHTTIHIYRLGVIRSNVNISDYETVYLFLGDYVIAHLLALLLYLTIEAPVAVLDRELLSKIKILPFPRKKKGQATAEEAQDTKREP